MRARDAWTRACVALRHPMLQLAYGWWQPTLASLRQRTCASSRSVCVRVRVQAELQHGASRLMVLTEAQGVGGSGGALEQQGCAPSSSSSRRARRSWRQLEAMRSCSGVASVAGLREAITASTTAAQGGEGGCARARGRAEGG